MIDKNLEKLGLNENERAVYIAVLSAGKTTPNQVASSTGINRTTIYSIARKLARMGLIGGDFKGKNNFLIAESARQVQNLIVHEERQLVERRAVVQELIQELAQIEKVQGYTPPRIRFVEEHDLEAFLKRRYYEWVGSAGNDPTWWGYHDSSFTERYRAFIRWSWIHGPKNLRVRFLTNASEGQSSLGKEFPERQVRIWGNGSDIHTSLWIIGDYIVHVQTRVRPHYLVEICDAELARNQRGIYTGIWKILEDADRTDSK